jgi:glucose/mannose transport system substrate-binding protein
MDLAQTIMEPGFQEVFNLNKGSIPARLNMDMSKFDTCAKDSSAEFVKSAADKTLVPSMAHGMSMFSAEQGAVFDTVTNFYNDDAMSSKDAVKALARAVKAAEAK